MLGMSDFIVGLSGGIASGKSELARRFEARGIVVSDADVVARQVVEPGPILARITAHFGSAVLHSDGTLDRRTLRQIIFADSAQRKALEAITHPAIRQRLEDACRDASGAYAIAMIPLLAEAGGRLHYPWLDRIVVVDVPAALQKQRLIHRDEISATLAEQMIGAQASREQRLSIADDVVVNDGDTRRLEQYAEQLDAHYRRLAAAKAADSTHSVSR